MSLAPPWAKPGVVLGLKIAIATMEVTVANASLSVDGYLERAAQIVEFKNELARIEEMKA